MAMRSPVNWVLLGLVVERQSYGYELAHRMRRLYGDLLPLSSDSRVYSALDALLSRGLIEEASERRVAAAGSRRQPKVPYRATAQGVEGYKEWLTAQMCEGRLRSQMIVRQLAVICQREPEAALEVIDSFEQAYFEEATNTPIPPQENSTADGGVSAVGVRLEAEERRLAMGAALSWIAYARSEIRALAGRR